MYCVNLCQWMQAHFLFTSRFSMQVITNLFTAIKWQPHIKMPLLGKGKCQQNSRNTRNSRYSRYTILQIHQIHHIHQKISGLRCCCCSLRHVANWLETWHSKSFTGTNVWVIITVNFLRLLILQRRDLGRCLLPLCPPWWSLCLLG